MRRKRTQKNARRFKSKQKKMKIVDNFIWKELILEGMLGIDSYDIFIKCSMVDFAE